jgi:hypothetical protein
MTSNETDDGTTSEKLPGKQRDADCSFCRKNYREVGPLVEGPGEVYICAACVDLAQDIIDHEKVRRSATDSLAYFRLKIDRIIQWAEDLKFRMDPQFSPPAAAQPPESPASEG